jgi:hypothetical protein
MGKTGAMEAEGEPEADGAWLDELMARQGGATAARWRQAGEDLDAFHQARAVRNAELDGLPLADLQRRTIDALDTTISLLRTTVLDAELRRHGWSERLTGSLADECARIRNAVERGSEAEPGGAPLDRWLREEVSPSVGDEDDLHHAVLEADVMPRAWARRLSTA